MDAENAIPSPVIPSQPAFPLPQLRHRHTITAETMPPAHVHTHQRGASLSSLPNAIGRSRSLTIPFKRNRDSFEARGAAPDSLTPPITSPLFSPTIPVNISPLTSSSSISSLTSSTGSPYTPAGSSPRLPSLSMNRRRAFSDLPVVTTLASPEQNLRLQRSTPMLPDDHDILTSPLVSRRLRPLESSSAQAVAAPTLRRRSGTSISTAMSFPSQHVAGSNQGAPSVEEVDQALAARGFHHPNNSGLKLLAQASARYSMRRSSSDEQFEREARDAEATVPPPPLRHVSSHQMGVTRLPSIRELSQPDSPSTARQPERPESRR